MFNIIFLLLFSPVSTSDNKNVVSCYWPDDWPAVKDINLQDYNISKQIINTIKDEKYIDCYERIWKGIANLTEDAKQNETEEVFDLLDSLFPLLPSQSRFMEYKAYNIFRQFISYLPIRRYENPDWILREWNPFRDNIIGFAAYTNANDSHEILEIYNNQTEDDIALNNLEVAGYVPKEFLSKLRDDKSYEEAQKVVIRMVLILNAKKFGRMLDLQDDFSYLIGVSIPGEYKGDDTPFLKGYFRGNWVEFGSEYKDFPTNPKETFLLSQIVFFGQINKTEYYDSVERSYCVSSNTGLLSPIYDISDENKKCLSNEICFDNFRLKYVQCYKNSGSYVCEEDDCRIDFPLNNLTRIYYDNLRICSYTEDASYCHQTLSDVANGAASYFDFLISLNHYIKVMLSVDRRVNYELLYKIIKNGLDLLEKNKEIPQISPLSTLILSFFIEPSSYTLRKNSRMTSLAFNSISEVVGLVIYKNNSLNPTDGISLLTRNNKTLSYSSDSDVNAILYVEGVEQNSIEMCNLYVFRGNFVEHKNETGKSDVIAAYCPDTAKAVLKVFLRTRSLDEVKHTEGYFNEGYSLEVPLRNDTVSLFYIRNSTICAPMSKFEVFDRPSDERNMTYRNMDGLSCSGVKSMKMKKSILFYASIVIVLLRR